MQNTQNKSKKNNNVNINVNENADSSNELWEGPIEKKEASKILKTKQYEFNTLEDAKKEAETLGEKYDSIVKVGNKYKIRQTRLIDKEQPGQRRTLWIRKSAKKNLKFKEN